MLGLGVLYKDPLGTGVEKQSISCLKLHGLKGGPQPSGQSLGLSFKHMGQAGWVDTGKSGASWWGWSCAFL